MIKCKSTFIIASLAFSMVLSESAIGQARFTQEERANVVSYWNSPGRYTVGLPSDPAKNGIWQVRLTAEASIWLSKYQRAIGANRLPPTQDATAVDKGNPVEWEKWVKAKIDYDGQIATLRANRLNGKPEISNIIAAPPIGPAPDTLVSENGNPPVFATAVTPLLHSIVFEDMEKFEYADNTPMRPRFAYYRFPQGVMAIGTNLRDMPADELKGLFASAGFNESEQRIAAAVSKLEGGFESVNTYDTGYVSIGFIQFACLEAGRGSLGEVMQSERTLDKSAFDNDFHRYGMDVTDDGNLVVLDPSTGAELTGKAAALKIIEDKRFAAVFQRAGRHSKEFRKSQIRVARSHYWPTEDQLTVVIGDKTLVCKVSDVIKSEAGIATLYDRKVNRGTLDPLANVVAKVMMAHNLTAISDIMPFEREIIVGMKYRTDFLKDNSLSQPK